MRRCEALLVAVCVCVSLCAGPTAGQQNWQRRTDRSGGGGGAAVSTQTQQQQFTGDRRQRQPHAETSRLWDPLLYNMFEVLISSLDDKFKRVDTIERAIHMVMRHMEIMDERLQRSNNMTARVLSRVEALEERLAGERAGAVSGRSGGFKSSSAASALPGRMERQLDAVTDQLRQLQTALGRLEQLQPKPAPARAARPTPVTVKRIQVPRARSVAAGSSAQDVSSQLVKDAEKMVQTVNEVRSKVVAMDNKLNFHMGHMSDNLSDVIKQVTAVSGVLLETPAANSSTPRSKLDVLVNKIEPLMDVSSKMDEVWNVVVGTKSSIDDLVPQSEALVHTTSRQERAINDIHSDLQERTKQIIDNLGMVEQRLNKQRIVIGGDEAADAAPPSPFSARATENTKRYIRPVAFPTRPSAIAAPQQGTARLDKEAPFDLLDQQFLEQYQNYSQAAAAEATTAAPAARGARGRPAGIVFPGRAAANAHNATFTFINGEQRNDHVGGYSCEEFRQRGLNDSGVYYLRIHGTSFWYLRVFCDMQTAGGGWTVIQRRDNYRETDQVSFDQPWEEYKQGFGNPTKAFWLGNENIFMLTNTEDYQLRIELEDFEGQTRYAQYRNFKMHGEKDSYKLEIGGYEGNAGDSMNDPWYGSNLSPFSTYDRDNDRSSLNCASMLKGGWWWRSCGRGLNGLYLSDPNDVIARQGIVWYRWRGWDYSLKRSVMMIRPNRRTGQHDGADAD